MKKLLKFHLPPALKTLIVFSFISSLIFSLSCKFEANDFIGISLLLIFASYLSSVMVLQASYQKNLHWNLLLPISRWKIFFSYSLSTLILFFIWIATSFLFLNLFIISIFHNQTLDQGLNKIFSSIYQIIEAVIYLSFSDLTIISFIILISIFFVLGNIKGLIDHKTLSGRLPSFAFTSKYKNLIRFFILILGIGIFHSLMDQPPVKIFGLWFMMGSMAFFFISYYVLLLPSRKYWSYMASGLTIGLLLTCFIYKLAIYQTKNNSPNLALNAHGFLGDLSPDLALNKNEKIKPFLEYQKSFKTLSLNSRLQILSTIDQFELQGQAYNVYTGNLNFFQYSKDLLAHPDFIKTINAINIQKAIDYNPGLYSRNFNTLLTLQRSNDELLYAINNIKFENINLALKYFMNIKPDQITDLFIDKLFNRAPIYFENLEKTQNKMNKILSYRLALYLLRYNSNQKQNNLLNQKIAYHKIKVEQLLKNTSISNLEMQMLKILKQDIETNLKLHKIKTDLVSLDKDNHRIPSNDKPNISHDCNKQAPGLINGKLEDENLINKCYRFFYADASGDHKSYLEQEGWITIDKFKKSYTTLRTPVIDYLYGKVQN